MLLDLEYGNIKTEFVLGNSLERTKEHNVPVPIFASSMSI